MGGNLSSAGRSHGRKRPSLSLPEKSLEEAPCTLGVSCSHACPTVLFACLFFILFRFFSPFFILFPEYLMLTLLPTGCPLCFYTGHQSLQFLGPSAICWPSWTDSSGKWSGAWYAKYVLVRSFSIASAEVWQAAG